jgi:1,4-dihydroxy-2-naphthoate octaprenyltransferase
MQIVSNLANDFGDFKKGTDASQRTDRSLASGAISESSMRKAIVIGSLASLGSGIQLLRLAFEGAWFNTILWLLIGLLCIAAALFYTVGKSAYGYKAFGDVSVLIFFGWVAVIGSFVMHTGRLTFEAELWLPSTAFGLLSVGVLNINNLRDIEGDWANGKKTIAGYLGANKAINYQLLLILLAFIFTGIYLYRVDKLWWSFVMLVPIYMFHWAFLKRIERVDRSAFNTSLKLFVLLNLLWVLMLSFILW